MANDTTLQSHIDLYAEQGYELNVVYLEEAGTEIIDFPESWNELSDYDSYQLSLQMQDAFNEIYPPQAVYTQGWEHSFIITQPATATRHYHQTTLAEIEAMATPLDLSKSGDGLTINLDWAYSDANQFIVAYTIYDEEGNALLGSEVPNGKVDLGQLWDGFSMGGFNNPLAPNLDSTQQVLRYTFYGFEYDMIHSRIDEAEDPALLTNDVRIVFFTGQGDEIYTPLQFSFEVPFNMALYEQHNQLVDLTSFWDISGKSTPDLEMYFNDLIITDTATTLFLCMMLPDDAPYGSYSVDTVKLFVDGDYVADQTIGNSPTLSEFRLSHYYTDDESSQASCGELIWHIAFDEMPKTIRFEVPAIIREMEWFGAFNSKAERDAYIDLFAEQGIDIAQPESDSLEISMDLYPQAWFDLEGNEQYKLLSLVRQKLFEQFPPQTAFTHGWDYTFEINTDSK